ncbi:ANTAR domain-containing protein [uncultured Williamsia sp.]|uniref:ANTAR domain-containing protein n=1 Tax=uncultured Williamsia sp. TaxID=259311 RepID=UPI002617E39F|nr:ANTAR domain-containing protein [uncultured Williamsia sp.]
MERFGVGADRAFSMLATLSQESNIPVAQVSRRLVDASSRSGAVTAADAEGAQ